MEIEHKSPLLWEKNLVNGVILALLVALYAPLVTYWFNGWLNKSIGIEHEYFSHGIIGLPFAVYIAWLNRKKWSRLENTSHPLSLVLLIVAGAFYLSGVWDFVNLSLPLVLIAICLGLKGINGCKLNYFPLLLVLLATPNSIPYLITPYTLPLQKFIAGTAGFILIQFGLDVTVEQIYLAVGGRLVEVAPYCAGLKMLFTCLYVALMVLYWTDCLKSRKKTILLLSGSVMISTMGNIIRNTLLSFFHGTDNASAFYWLHDSWGGDVYSALMLGLILLLHTKVIEKLAP